MKKKTIIISALAAVGVLWGGWSLTGAFYLDEHEAIQKEASDLARRIEGFNAASEGLRADRKALRALASTMLGGDADIVEHWLRTLLSALAEREGLGEVVISHGRPSPVENPARRRGSGVNRTLRRVLSSQNDFYVIHARLQGVGTFEQTLRALAAVRGQPWIHRVEGFTISPRGKDREEFVLKVDLSTLFAPDLVKPDDPVPALQSPDSGASKRVASLVARDPFHLASPPAEEPAASPPVAVVPRPVSPVPSAYARWRVTGVVESLQGGGRVVEVMLARTDTGEMKTLRRGESLLDATLDDAAGESAFFVLDGKRVVVRTGQTLAEARPDESVHSAEHPSG
ncbi:MAG TPA: hypothetical protein ENK11_08210 [Phycisphaerales bacterium]|nr:hypothetical protein [Phycisphaerales bacterium]